MGQIKPGRVFTKEELYNACGATTAAMSVEEEIESVICHWTEFADPINAYDNLSTEQQDAFDEDLTKVAKKFKFDFDSLKSIESFSELERQKNRLVSEVAIALDKFLIQ